MTGNSSSGWSNEVHPRVSIISRDVDPFRRICECYLEGIVAKWPHQNGYSWDSFVANLPGL